jgi:hypothetical protein
VSADPKSLLNRERSDTKAALSVRTKSVSELASLRGISFRRSFDDTLDLLTPSNFDDRRLTTLLLSPLKPPLIAESESTFNTGVADDDVDDLIFAAADDEEVKPDEPTTDADSFDFALDGKFNETADDLPDTKREGLNLTNAGLDEFTFDLPELTLTPANLDEPKICLSRSPPLFDLAREIIERITSSFLISCQPGTESSFAIEPSCFAVNVLSSADVAMLYP